jgi:iron-sulfur cluster assembly protein
MISLTKNAAEQIQKAAELSDAKNLGLRVAAKVNEGGMLEFGMGFDQERENDAVVEAWGVTLLVSSHSAPYLQDVTVDFAEVAPGEERFVFMKPGADVPSSDCGSDSGCGSGGCGSGGCS